jgi:hypothetical protein
MPPKNLSGFIVDIAPLLATNGWFHLPTYQALQPPGHLPASRGNSARCSRWGNDLATKAVSLVIQKYREMHVVLTTIFPE